MPKEDLIKLAEALASVGFNIVNFEYEDSFDTDIMSPRKETVKLEISKRISKKENS